MVATNGMVMDSRWARVARGFTAAAFAVFVAAFSHTLAGAHAPSAFGVVVAMVISVMICTMLAGRTLSLWRLTASVGLSQLLFHWLFSGLGAPVAAAHDMSAMTVDATAPAHHDTPTMWLAHAAAAVITIAALRFAGAAFWGVRDTARLLFARFTAVLVPVISAARAPLPARRVSDLPHELTVLLSPMRHRGPPMELA